MLPPGRERFGFSQTRKPARKPCGRQAAGKGKGHEPALTIPHDAAGTQALDSDRPPSVPSTVEVFSSLPTWRLNDHSVGGNPTCWRSIERRLQAVAGQP